MPDIKVTIVSASNLADSDEPFNNTNPYVYVTLNGYNAQRTSTSEVSSDPTWNETLTFESVESPASKVLNIAVYDDDTFKDDKIGGCKFDIGTLIATTEPQEFERVVDDGVFSDASLKFIIETDGSFGNPEGGVGSLTIFVKSCTGLDDADYGGTTDPYCYIKIDGCEPQQTETLSGTINPEWNQEIVFEEIEDPLSKKVKLLIYDDDTFSRDDKIGECEVELSDLFLGQPKDYDVCVDWMLFGMMKQATLSFTLTANGWGNA
jgi:Ca2+-dependent lipid-binding protein